MYFDLLGKIFKNLKVRDLIGIFALFQYVSLF